MTTEDLLLGLQNRYDVLISLTARSAFGAERLEQIVRRGKRNPGAYVRVYNRLDGKRTATELAPLAGVTRQAISGVLENWEEEGIVYNLGTDNQPRYKRLMRLPEPKEQKALAEFSAPEP